MILSFPKCFVRPTEGVETEEVIKQTGRVHVYALKCTLTKFVGLAGRDRVVYRPNTPLTVEEANRDVT